MEAFEWDAQNDNVTKGDKSGIRSDGENGS